MEKSIRLMAKLTFIFSVITMSVVLVATSCNKVGGDQSKANNNNANNNNNPGGGDGGPKVCAGSGGGTSTVTQPTTTRKMILAPDVGTGTYVKIVGDTVYVSAQGLAAVVTPFARKTDYERGELDIITATIGRKGLFTISYPRPAGGNVNEKGAFAFVNCHDIKVTDMAFEAFKGVDSTGNSLCASDEETEAIARGSRATGSTCASIVGKNGESLVFYHELGTIFYNTDLSKARAGLSCSLVATYFSVALSDARPIASADAVPNAPADSKLNCGISVLNNKIHNGVDISTQEIDDNWVDGPGGTATEEVELYAVGLFTGGKTLGEIASTLGFTVDSTVTDTNTAGNGLFEFKKPWSNTAFRKLLEHADSAWADLRFKVKIVTSTEFANL